MSSMIVLQKGSWDFFFGGGESGMKDDEKDTQDNKKINKIDNLFKWFFAFLEVEGWRECSDEVSDGEEIRKWEGDGVGQWERR